MRQFISFLFKIIFFFLLLNSVYSENLKSEILIESDSMHIDELKSLSTFSGNVVLKYGALSLSSDKVIISRKKNNISLIQAFGTPASFNFDNELPENNKLMVLQKKYCLTLKIKLSFLLEMLILSLLTIQLVLIQFFSI